MSELKEHVHIQVSQELKDLAADLHARFQEMKSEHYHTDVNFPGGVNVNIHGDYNKQEDKYYTSTSVHLRSHCDHPPSTGIRPLKSRVH